MFSFAMKDSGRLGNDLNFGDGVGGFKIPTSLVSGLGFPDTPPVPASPLPVSLLFA